MFCLNDTMHYFLCQAKTDMHKGMNSLCGVIHSKMGYDVRLGEVFIFINCGCTTMKLLRARWRWSCFVYKKVLFVHKYSYFFTFCNEGSEIYYIIINDKRLFSRP